jgi:hypothetical protein
MKTKRNDPTQNKKSIRINIPYREMRKIAADITKAKAAGK